MYTIRQEQFEALKECFKNGGSVRDGMRAAGVAKHTALRYQRAYYHNALPVLKPTDPRRGDMAGICRSLSQPERHKLWEAKEGPIPAGKRLGCLCKVRYCGNLEHMCLEERHDTHWHDWAAYVEPLFSLEVGEFHEFPVLPLKEMHLLRAVVAQRAGRISYAIRTSKDGTLVRLYRTGSWEPNRYGYPTQEKAHNFAARIPVVWFPTHKPYQRKISTKRPHLQYLGLVAFESMHDSAVPHGRRCSVKACAFPANGSDKCHRHEHFYEYKWSMEWRALDPADVYRREETLHPLFTTLQGWELNRSADIAVFDHAGIRNRGWKLSEDWWRENVLKAEREVLVQYAPEQSATQNKQHTGAFVLWKGFGKKKIRKKQRMRPQGWHGNHPEQKPMRRFTRDVLEDVPQWAPQPQVLTEDNCEDADDYMSLYDVMNLGETRLTAAGMEPKEELRGWP